MGEMNTVSLVALEDIDYKVAEVFDCLDDIYNVPSCLSEEREAFSRSVRRRENGSHQREASTDLEVVAIEGERESLRGRERERA